MYTSVLGENTVVPSPSGSSASGAIWRTGPLAPGTRPAEAPGGRRSAKPKSFSRTSSSSVTRKFRPEMSRCTSRRLCTAVTARTAMAISFRRSCQLSDVCSPGEDIKDANVPYFARRVTMKGDGVVTLPPKHSTVHANPRTACMACTSCFTSAAYLRCWRLSPTISCFTATACARPSGMRSMQWRTTDDDPVASLPSSSPATAVSLSRVMMLNSSSAANVRGWETMLDLIAQRIPWGRTGHDNLLLPCCHQPAHS